MDGPARIGDVPKVEETRRLIQSATGFHSVRVVERTSNLGVARNVAQGVTEVLGSSGRAIVVEDDLEVSPGFLAFMNEGLDLYAADVKVASIHGYVYPTGRQLPASFFLRGADCWGWATWSRAWEHYTQDARELLARMRSCKWRHEFDFDGAYPYFRMLHDASVGRVDSWAIRWYASAFLAGMYTLYPGVSLVLNKGHDGTGTHGEMTSRYDTVLSAEGPGLTRVDPETNQLAYEAFREYFLSLRPSLGTRALRRLRDLVSLRKQG